MTFFQLKDQKARITIEPAREDDHQILLELFNSIIQEGNTYPQLDTLKMPEFKQYFLSHECYCVKRDVVQMKEEEESEIIGAFYIKPNFVGRCSHICNGGFIVKSDYRGKGVGSIMADEFERLAKLSGRYTAIMFNLVFATNVASISLWTRRGYTRLGVIPKAGNLKEFGLTDAIIFYKSLQ